MARGNFRRRLILIPTGYGRSSGSSDTDPRNLGGRDTYRAMDLRQRHSGSYGGGPNALPALKGVAKVGGISVHAPAMDPDGQSPLFIMCSAPRGPRTQVPSSGRCHAAGGRKVPHIIKGWTPRKGTATGARGDHPQLTSCQAARRLIAQGSLAPEDR